MLRTRLGRMSRRHREPRLGLASGLAVERYDEFAHPPESRDGPQARPSVLRPLGGSTSRGREASTAGHRTRHIHRPVGPRTSGGPFRGRDRPDHGPRPGPAPRAAVRRGLRRHRPALGGPLGGRADPGRRDPRRDRRRRGGGRPRPAGSSGPTPSSTRWPTRASSRSAASSTGRSGNPEVLGPDPCPFTSAVATEAPVEHGAADRRQPLPAGHGHAGLRRRRARSPT